jgi:hypothetical protein
MEDLVESTASRAILEKKKSLPLHTVA